MNKFALAALGVVAASAEPTTDDLFFRKAVNSAINSGFEGLYHDKSPDMSQCFGNWMDDELTKCAGII